MGCNENPTILTGDICNEESILLLYQKANTKAGICGLYLDKLFLHNLFQKYDQAIKDSIIARKNLMAQVALIKVAVFHFYESLAHLALFSERLKKEQKKILRQVAINQKKMKKWASYAPMNHLHKWQLVEAEKAKVLGKDKKAIEFYNLAIAGAKENQYIQEEALANELAAKFYLEKKETETARKYMIEARFCYEHWGAKAKVDHLNQTYSELLSGVPTITAKKTDIEKTRISLQTTIDINTTNQIESEQLDLTSVMKASQVISGEIQIEKLLSSMMKIIIENAGAQKGYLILKSDENLLIEGVPSASVCNEFF